MDANTAGFTARHLFRNARFKAVLAGLYDAIRRRPRGLFSLDEVRQRLNIRSQRYAGLQTIPLDNVIGSEGRYADFDRQFLPLNDTLHDRWTGVGKAFLLEIELPPIELYKIGDSYFVRDGNHRVSVARQQGQSFIDAFVTELVVDVPLTPDISLRDLVMKEEYSDFLEWTHLHTLRPDERIEFSEFGGYLDLVHHINAHRYFLGKEQQRYVSRDEAVMSWYDTVYMPIVAVIREQDVLRHFPSRTEADLYRWIIEHRWYMRERTGTDPGADDAVRDYVELFSRRSVAKVVIDALQGMVDRLGR